MCLFQRSACEAHKYTTPMIDSQVCYPEGLDAQHTSCLHTSTQPLWSIHKCALWQLCVSRAHKHSAGTSGDIHIIYKHDILFSAIAYFMHDTLSSPQIMRTWLYQQFDLLREKRCEVEVMPCYVHPHHLVKPYRKERKDSVFSPFHIQICLAKMSQMSLMIWQSG